MGKSLKERGYTKQKVLIGFRKSRAERASHNLPLPIEESVALQIIEWLISESPKRNDEWEVPTLLCEAIVLGGYFMLVKRELRELEKRVIGKLHNIVGMLQYMELKMS